MKTIVVMFLCALLCLILGIALGLIYGPAGIVSWMLICYGAALIIVASGWLK